MDFAVSSRQGLRVGNRWIPCEVTRRPLDIRMVELRSTEKILVPAQHEKIIRVPLEDTPLQAARYAVLEPLVEDRRGVRVARALVDMWQEDIPIRVVNLTDSPVHLRKDHPIAMLEPLEVTQSSVSSPIIRRSTLEGQTVGDSKSGDTTEGGGPGVFEEEVS